MQAANEHSKVAIEGTVVQPNMTFSSASSAIGQKYRFAALAVRKSSSISSSVIHTPAGQSNGVWTAKAGLRMGLDVTHPKATGSPQEEVQPSTETSLNHTRHAHNTGHRRAEAVADRDTFEQRGNSNSIQAGDSLLLDSKFGNVAQASPKPVDNTSLSIATRDTTHSAATLSSPVTLEVDLKYQKGVQVVSRPSIGANQQSNTPAPEVFLDGDSTEKAESQKEYGAQLENRKEPRMSSNSEDVNIVRAENNEDTRKQCDDRYKNMDSSDISLIFENRRKGQRDKREKKTRKREARVQIPRGQHPYCSYRTVTSRPRDYRSTIRSLPCKCGVPHEILDAKEWKSSPAEDGWDSSLRKGDNPDHEPRKVTFAEPIVIEIQTFEEWWEEEYGLSDRYYSRGPFLHRSMDLSTKADDDEQIRKLGNLAQQLSCDLGLAASNAIANSSDMINSPAKRTSSRLIAMAAESHRVQKSPSKHEKRQGEKQTIRRTGQIATSPSIKAKLCSATHVKLAADLLPSSDWKVVESAPEHQAGVVRDQRSGEAINAPGKSESESESAGETARNPAFTDSQPETSSTVTSPSQQDVDGLGDDYSYRTGLRPLRAFRDRCDSRNLRSPGPQYGGRTRWSPYQLTGIHKRHSPHGKKTEGVRLMNDAIVRAALQQELALQADEANEVPIIEELPINEAVANAALEQELSLQADFAREVPTTEKLSLHIAAGEAKIKEWWDSLYKSHASSAAPAFSSGLLTRTENSERAYYDYYDTSMSDPEEDAELSGPDEDADMLDPEEDSEMSDA